MPNLHTFVFGNSIMHHSLSSLCTPVLPQANGTYKTQSPVECKSAEHAEGAVLSCYIVCGATK